MKKIISEIFRKTIHFSGLFLIILYTFILNEFSKTWANLTLVAVLLILLEVERIRIEHKPKIVAIFKELFRKREEENISGAVFFVISCIICFAVFDYWIAILALLMTVVGDLVSALMGRIFGKTKIYKDKSIVGTVSGLFANISVSMFVLSGFPILTLIMASIASFTEMITIKLDDNLTVPLFAGFFGQIYLYYSGIILPPDNFIFSYIFSIS